MTAQQHSPEAEAAWRAYRQTVVTGVTRDDRTLFMDTYDRGRAAGRAARLTTTREALVAWFEHRNIRYRGWAEQQADGLLASGIFEDRAKVRDEQRLHDAVLVRNEADRLANAGQVAMGDVLYDIAAAIREQVQADDAALRVAISTALEPRWREDSFRGQRIDDLYAKVDRIMAAIREQGPRGTDGLTDTERRVLDAARDMTREQTQPTPSAYTCWSCGHPGTSHTSFGPCLSPGCSCVKFIDPTPSSEPLDLDPLPYVITGTDTRVAAPSEAWGYNTHLDPRPGYEQDRTKYEGQR